MCKFRKCPVAFRMTSKVLQKDKKARRILVGRKGASRNWGQRTGNKVEANMIIIQWINVLNCQK